MMEVPESTSAALASVLKRLMKRVLGKFYALNAASISYLWGLICKYKFLFSITVFTSLLAAVFEGGTMGMLALALQVLGAGDDEQFVEQFGKLGQAIDFLDQHFSRSGLFFLLVGLAILAQIFRSLLQFSSKAYAARLQARISAISRLQMFKQMLKISYGSYSKYKIGDLINSLNLAIHMGRLFWFFSLLMCECFLLAAYILILLWISWIPTIGAAIVLLPISLLLKSVVKRIRRIATDCLQAIVKQSLVSAEFLQGMALIRSFGNENHAYERLKVTVKESTEEQRRSAVYQASVMPLVESGTALLLGAALVVGFILTGDGFREHLPIIGIFLVVLYRMIPRFGTANTTYAQLTNEIPYILRITDLLNTLDKQYPKEGQRESEGLKKSIDFVNVVLRYNGMDEPALNNVSFSIPKGSMIALVGASGSGKSSVAGILLRLHDITGGRVLIDGHDFYGLNATSWRNHVGVVTQDVFLFHDTVTENIRFGRLDASDEDVRRAAEVACAATFIEQLKDGYSTIVGERGVELSGGQRQRIAIARALIRNPELLILDEATSALDSEAEEQIHRGILDIRSECTILVIAHRLSTVTAADCIHVIENGAIVESGKHQDLISAKGRYAQYWNMQVSNDSSEPLENDQKGI